VDRGYEVVAVGRREKGGAQCVDLGDVDAVRGLFRAVRPDFVFHLAGSSRGSGFSELLRVNCGLATVLLDAAEAEGCLETRFLFVGTAAEYGRIGADEEPVTEDRRAAPVSAYGVSKLAQTEVGLAASRKGQRVVVVRPSNVIGPGMSETLALGSFARQLQRIRNGEAEPIVRVGDLTPVRDFVDVRDVTRAMVDLGSTDGALGRVINVSSGAGFQIREALDALVRAFHLKVRIETEERRRRPADASRFVASSALLASMIRYEPRPLQDMVEFIAGLGTAGPI
jgi:GDP-4-dehydro-6-deoxy-D-mannose reductase